MTLTDMGADTIYVIIQRTIIMAMNMGVLNINYDNRNGVNYVREPREQRLRGGKTLDNAT